MATDFDDILASVGVRRLEVYVHGIVDELTRPVAIVAMACEAGQGRLIKNCRHKLSDERATRTHEGKR
jgi:hypothetical protein